MIGSSIKIAACRPMHRFPCREVRTFRVKHLLGKATVSLCVVPALLVVASFLFFTVANPCVHGFVVVAPHTSKPLLFPPFTTATATQKQIGATKATRGFRSPSSFHEHGKTNEWHVVNHPRIIPQVPQCRRAGKPQSPLLLLAAANHNDGNQHDHQKSSKKKNYSYLSSTVLDFVSLMRPWTLFQAVGAWMVGRLVVLQSTSSGIGVVSTAKLNVAAEMWALWSVYLSYGVGMVANDCADANLDASSSNNSQNNYYLDDNKSQRAIASGRISVRQGWYFVAFLSMAALLPSYLFVSPQFTWWTSSNIAIMLLYAWGLQNLLLVKNILVGWLCISPLWGAKTLALLLSNSAMFQTKMKVLAMTGFTLGTIREILKDCQDVDLDRGTKQTLPMVLGVEAARRWCMVALGITLAAAQSPLFRQLFAKGSAFPIYSTAWWVAVVWTLRASWGLRDSSAAAIGKQQSLVKQSIYVLLLGLIGSILMQK